MGGASAVYKLHLEAEKAELEFQQARRRAALLEKEASLEMEKTQLQARDLLENAELTARRRREIAETSSNRGDISLGRFDDDPFPMDIPSCVQTWLEQVPGDDEADPSKPSNSEPDLILPIDGDQPTTTPVQVPGDCLKETPMEGSGTSPPAQVIQQFCPLQAQKSVAATCPNQPRETQFQAQPKEAQLPETEFHQSQPERLTGTPPHTQQNTGIPSQGIGWDTSAYAAPAPTHVGSMWQASTPMIGPVPSSKRGLNPEAKEWPLTTQEETPVPARPKRKPCTSIDGWIDELIPGVESELLDEMLGLGQHDRLLAFLIRSESEKGLPAIELPTFNGAAKEWPKFIERFHVQVHHKPGITDTRRMDILQSHLTGEAQKLVQGIGFTGMCYAEALKELKRTFGHRNKVARAYLDQVTNGPALASNSVQALRNFFVNVRDCIITLSKLNYTTDLNGTDVLVRAAKRLPSNKIGQWNRFMAKVTKDREPTIFDLREWLQECLMADSNPYAIQYDRGEARPKDKATDKDKRPKQSTLLNTVAVDGKKDAHSSLTTTGATWGRKSEKDGYKERKPCGLCQAQHPIHRCSKFLAKGVPARRDTVKDMNLCFNCLKPSHRVRDCSSTVRCKEASCGKKHHTLLHEPEDKKAKAVNISQTPTQHDKPTLFQLVTVFATGNNGSTVPTVALLDSGSQITLIHGSLAKDLGLKGERKPLIIKTMNSELTRQSRNVSLRIKSFLTLRINFAVFAVLGVPQS
jgi:hypothetical protein